MRMRGRLVRNCRLEWLELCIIDAIRMGRCDQATESTHVPIDFSRIRSLDLVSPECLPKCALHVLAPDILDEVKLYAHRISYHSKQSQLEYSTKGLLTSE